MALAPGRTPNWVTAKPKPGKREYIPAFFVYEDGVCKKILCDDKRMEGYFIQMEHRLTALWNKPTCVDSVKTYSHDNALKRKLKGEQYCSLCGYFLNVGDHNVNIPGLGWVCDECLNEHKEEVMPYDERSHTKTKRG